MVRPATRHILRPALDAGPRAANQHHTCSPGPRIGVQGVVCSFDFVGDNNCALDEIPCPTSSLPDLIRQSIGPCISPGCPRHFRMDARIKSGHDEVEGWSDQQHGTSYVPNLMRDPGRQTNTTPAALGPGSGSGASFVRLTSSETATARSTRFHAQPRHCRT